MHTHLALELKGPIKVHVVAHGLSLPAIDGRVTSKALLKFALGQQVDPHHLQSVKGVS